MLDGVLLLVGIALLITGGDLLVRGASSLADTLGVSPLIIGLTIVAFGTSAPELSVNITAAIKGNTEISFGNIIGSNIANIGLILGIAALLKPLTVRGTVIVREIPMMILASTAGLVMCLDRVMRSEQSMFDRSDGLLLLLFFCVFLYYNISDALKGRGQDSFSAQTGLEAGAGGKRSVWTPLAMSLAGIVILALAGRLTVNSAVGLARALSISEAFIGLFLVAVGTSLPELVTSVMAAARSQSDIAIGNVVGSSIFNLLFIMGISACIRQTPVPAQGMADLTAMVLFSVALLPISASGRRIISRPEGFLLLALYIAFIAWRGWASSIA